MRTMKVACNFTDKEMSYDTTKASICSFGTVTLHENCTWKLYGIQRVETKQVLKTLRQLSLWEETE